MDAGTFVHYGGTSPCPSEAGVTGAQVSLHNRIKRNFMIYQDRLETKLLQLFVHTQNSEGFSLILVVSFEVNIVAEHANAKKMTIMGALLH